VSVLLNAATQSRFSRTQPRYDSFAGHQQRLALKGKKSCMTEERIDLLNQLNFSWEVRPSLERPRAAWHQRFDELQEFYGTYKHFRVPHSTHRHLHAWCQEQKQRLKNVDKSGKDASKRMGPDRVKALIDLGFTKDVDLAATPGDNMDTSDDMEVDQDVNGEVGTGQVSNTSDKMEVEKVATGQETTDQAGGDTPGEAEARQVTTSQIVDIPTELGVSKTATDQASDTPAEQAATDQAADTKLADLVTHQATEEPTKAAEVTTGPATTEQRPSKEGATLHGMYLQQEASEEDASEDTAIAQVVATEESGDAEEALAEGVLGEATKSVEEESVEVLQKACV
jgi:hypothetical protein